MRIEIPEDMKEILEEFLVEAEEIIQSLDQDLIALEDDPTDKELLNKIFRGMHTLKGGAGFIGLTSIVNIAHKIEDIFNKLRNEELTLNSEMMDTILEGIDQLKEGIDRLKEEGEIPDEDEVANTVKKLEAILNGESPSTTPSESNSSKETENENKQANINFVDGIDEDIKKIILQYPGKNLGDILEELILLPPDKRPSMEVIEKLEQIIAEGKDISDFIKKEEPKPKKEDKPKAKKQKDEKSEVIRVDVERVETLMNLVGELVLDRNRIVKLASTLEINSNQDANENLIEAITGMSRTVSDLQDAVMKLRMQPVKKIFSKFPRVVRDLAKKLNKKVQLVLEGEDTEIDRSILDKLEDPLIHLVRNSLDHGIETPDERIMMGKPEVGTIKLSALQEGDRIVISIEDDGKGIDANIIKRKAVEKGLITEEQAESMTDKEAYELIFLPGFSTADKISDVSGRGVGMDVVASTIHSLRGNIEIDSELGKGTKIVMKLPLTVAIIRTLMVGINNRIFAIPLYSVVEIVRYNKNAIKNVGNFKSFMLRDEVHLLFTLNELFDMEDTREKEFIVLVKIGEKNIAIAIEDLYGEEEIVIKPLGQLLSDVPGIAGATITGDGKVVLIIDANSLITDVKNTITGAML